MTTDIDTFLGESVSSRARADEVDVAKRIAAAIRKNVESRRPARRDAHPKAHGCVRAEFRVVRDVPARLAHGVFVSGKTYPAWIRFSNGDGNINPNRKGDSRGMAIKLLDVPGEKLLPSERGASTQDFLLIDHPVFVIDDPGRYLDLIERSASPSLVAKIGIPLTLGGRGLLNFLAIMRSTRSSLLETRYWSTTAYCLGSGEGRLAVKYSARPHQPATTRMPASPGESFLRETLIRELGAGDATFDFLVQPRTTRA